MHLRDWRQELRLTDSQPEPEGLGCLGAVALGVIGALLLLPGLCSLLSTPAVFDSPRGGESFKVAPIWALGLILGGLGVVVITIAFRAFIRARPDCHT
jgi:hypothetical protein